MIRFFNTLSRKIEEFRPADPNKVSLYCCGPTVYDYAHIGNFRTYVLADILVRSLRFMGYEVIYVSNITDVGHLVSDSDTGEDKMEKGARREGKTAWDIAKFYTGEFLRDSKLLNLIEPDFRPRPTQLIPEQIDMVNTLMQKGFAYKIEDGIYFDTARFPDYAGLTGQDPNKLKAGARVEINPHKHNPNDFALWKLSPDNTVTGKKRDMEWDSPWGKGYPGWHIECSVMSRKYLGERIDIHTGGVDLIPVHHTNEIAQSEAASGKRPFVRYWIHGQFIQVDGEKMSKSKNNFYRLSDITDRKYEPLALRYLYLTAHYRAYLNFTWQALETARNSLTELRRFVANIRAKKDNRSVLSPEKSVKIEILAEKFRESLSHDLNLPRALAVVWETVKSNIPSEDKYELILDFDRVLGLDLSRIESARESDSVPEEILSLVARRDSARQSHDFRLSDSIRDKISRRGFDLEDTPQGAVVKKRV